MEERATGLILRTYPLTESSLIVHWLTSELGRIATVAKGARRPKSPFRGRLDLFYLADFTFARSRRSDLHTLREVALRDTHSRLREDVAWLAQAAYAAALIEQNTETETPLPAFYNLLLGLLQYLPQQPPQPLTLFTLETRLLRELGLQPDPLASPLSPGAQQILQRLLTSDWAILSRLRLTQALELELDHFLRSFLAEHLGRLPKNRPALPGPASGPR